MSMPPELYDAVDRFNADLDEGLSLDEVINQLLQEALAPVGYLDEHAVPESPDAARWKHTEGAVRWSLTDAGADGAGKAIMADAVRQGNVSFVPQMGRGFTMTQQHSPTSRALFNYCARRDKRRLYNIGRSALGLPGVAVDSD
jgi:hypothetical protein